MQIGQVYTKVRIAHICVYLPSKCVQYMSIAHLCALMHAIMCIWISFWALMELESPEHICAHNDAIALLYEISLLLQIIKFRHQMELQGTHWWREIDINGTQFAFNILLFTSIIGVFFLPKIETLRHLVYCYCAI